ncbi:MAG: GntR family transcriptional regulator [Chloroflexi bacterium]|nr:GntR family transcriptional regulator [Chloroflexota bacterium]
MLPLEHIPRYILIREQIRQKVLNGEYKPGERIPSEPQLAREFNVSRGTVEKAIRGLVEEGILVREQGRGTFVAKPRLESALFRLSTFADEAKRRGFTPATRLIRAHVRTADDTVAQALDLPPEAQIIEIVRVHLADGEPLVYEVRQLAYDLCPELLSEDLEHSSLHELLLYKYHIPLVKARFTIHAITLTDEAATLLHVEEGSPGFAVERITYRTGSEPAVRMYQLWRGDRFYFSEEVVGLGIP